MRSTRGCDRPRKIDEDTGYGGRHKNKRQMAKPAKSVKRALFAVN